MTTRRMLLRGTLTAGGVVAVGMLASACGGAPETPGSAGASGSGEALEPGAKDLLAAHGIDAATAEDAVTALDQVPKRRPLEMDGSVGYDRVLFADDSEQIEVPLSGGQFYLAMAPFRTRTHECFLHSLGGCQGELTDAPVHVEIVTDEGETLVDEDATTSANGFVGFWIPRDRAGTVIVTADSETATSPFDSGPQGPTCLTTLRLA